MLQILEIFDTQVPISFLAWKSSQEVHTSTNASRCEHQSKAAAYLSQHIQLLNLLSPTDAVAFPSRLGDLVRTRIPPEVEHIPCKTGNANAAVLPLPVSARPTFPRSVKVKVARKMPYSGLVLEVPKE